LHWRKAATFAATAMGVPLTGVGPISILPCTLTILFRSLPLRSSNLSKQPIAKPLPAGSSSLFLAAYSLGSFRSSSYLSMSSPARVRPVAAVVACRIMTPASRSTAIRTLATTASARRVAARSRSGAASTQRGLCTTAARRALPAGRPPHGFRPEAPPTWDSGESAFAKASSYFLLTEMFRGMYVVMENFFRQP
jgi:hypothetical protein